jgi:4a-hydroxytetrahydrobiopterin dehydratase
MKWIEKDNALHLELHTPDFLSAYRIVGALVDPAEKMNHHPDVAFGWGYVRIALTSHDAGAVTSRDRLMASLIDEALMPLGF